MITLILGGARSGKSAYAETLAAKALTVTYLATADAGDDEMAERIRIHRARRPANWRTWEGHPDDLPSTLSDTGGTLLLDCLTMYLTKRFLASPASESEDESAWFAEERSILEGVASMLESHAVSHQGRDDAHLIVVSNEVGFDLVPPYLMGRRFRDMQGHANQAAAKLADNVALVIAGIPLWLKGTPRTEENL